VPEAILQMPVGDFQGRRRGWFREAIAHREPQVVAATYTFQAPATESFNAAIHFTGVRVNVDGVRGPGDSFERIEVLDRVPGEGQMVSVTTRVLSAGAGDWRVLAQPVTHSDGSRLGTPPHVIQTTSQFGVLAQGPGVHLWAWPNLVGLGALVALILQFVLADRAGLPASGVLGLSLLACLLGFLGGKLWYLRLHRKPIGQILHSGACIQGFLLVALTVLAAGSVWAGWSPGRVLDLTTPGIFLAVAVGRPGCWFTGCCSGRPTRSRWGIVSTNRWLRLRRLPVQLYEAASGLVIGLVSLVAVLDGVPVAGSVFVAAIAAYTMVRQWLFGLRVEARTRWGRVITFCLAAVALIGALASVAA
jgi:phosphatidylglycerol:prolipoprotein diacylglycerol transferase